jgi:hypothetical protein
MPADPSRERAREIVAQWDTEGVLDAIVATCPPEWVAARLVLDIENAIASARVEAAKEERERVVARILDILDGRMDREQYGHAKAAVALDIEAIRAAFALGTAADGGGEGANG